MKKITIIISVLLLVFVIINGNGESEEGKKTQPNQWGITLEAENITPTGLTIVCHQAGGANVDDLTTGSFYVIQKLDGSEWIDVEYIPQEYEIAWTSEAWFIQKDGTTKWEVHWERLYGKLPAGEYRIGKSISNFRGTGDYDNETVYASFRID